MSGHTPLLKETLVLLCLLSTSSGMYAGRSWDRNGINSVIDCGQHSYGTLALSMSGPIIFLNDVLLVVPADKKPAHINSTTSSSNLRERNITVDFT